MEEQENAGQEEKTQAVLDMGVKALIQFIGEEDRNMRMIWPGELPRKGEIFRLQGRPGTYFVDSVEWHINVNRQTKQLERGVHLIIRRRE